ncbi:MAG: bifunctional (p)ppGpp synthetase/guanosine-3',5'-bis(diphosphate) 3'-pyrophosphohydrolase [Gammaproteobacteria bacterium]|nr:bifunctional (p)ppGpp synthetase/guanosine-3',5'-bis(diphosphate) 3'-pyrophosphohydrolase [Gammaproteobacteria bacterium]
MVQVRRVLTFKPDHTIDIASWIQNFSLSEDSIPFIRQVLQLAELTGSDQFTPYGITCFEQGLEIAEILINLNFDTETIAAGLIYSAVTYTDLTIDDVKIQLGSPVANLVQGVQQMDVISNLGSEQRLHNRQQIDNIRKMLLAMITDVRVVVIKLAERLSIMRAIRNMDDYTRYQIAQETMEIFAPLANRLGLYEIKWELEDLAFYYLDPDNYHAIAKYLAERRIDRENRVKDIVNTLKTALLNVHIEATIYGRPKHIYSIMKKMLRKNVDCSKIYDVLAVRILVDTVEACYAALSIVHQLWQSIPEEFDDYVATPKPNGYRSIHTAVVDQQGRPFEVQIRTYKMHEEAEQGIAAHWIYKEGKRQTLAYEQKIAWLRQLLDWQKQLVHDTELPKALEKSIFEDRVYVFTPKGDIIDLPSGATPLDFAYHVHTEVGHRCRGAKINGKMVPLTYSLKTSDRVDILTGKESHPSRDWLSPDRGYLKTPVARAKVLQWFKKEDESLYIAQGKALLDQELTHSSFRQIDLNQIVKKLNYPHVDKMLAAIGVGSLRTSRVIQEINKIQGIDLVTAQEKEVFVSEAIKPKASPKKLKLDQVEILGVDHLLSHVAKCCKPVPGDPIVGYITRGQGLSIHHKNCPNIGFIRDFQKNRLIPVNWNIVAAHNYPVDLEIITFQKAVINQLLAIFTGEKINIVRLETLALKKAAQFKILLTIEIDSIQTLDKMIIRIHQLPQVIEVRRV